METQRIILNPDGTFSGPFTHQLTPEEIGGRPVVEITEAQYNSLQKLPGRVVWTGSGFVEKAAVPASVTNPQLREWLIRNGVINKLQAAIASIPNKTEQAVMEAWFSYSPTVRRDSEKVVALSAALGMTPEQVDAAFIAASKF